MHPNKRYIFNPYYILRPDRHRVVLTESGSYFDIPPAAAESPIYSFIHPIFAVILCFFDGRSTLQHSVRNIASYFKTSQHRVQDIVGQLVENERRVGFELQGHLSVFPRNILLECRDSHDYREYRPELFGDIKELDFATERLYEGPLDLSLLVNTTCATDCEYCYVDRSVRGGCQISLSRLFEIVDEAKAMGVRKVDIAGTEIFLYRQWDLLVERLLASGYYPYLSTKLPLNKNKIRRLKDIGIGHLQVSIDSLRPTILSKMLNVNGKPYAPSLLRSLEELDRHDIELRVNTVVTNTNASVENLTGLLLELRKIGSLSRVVINEAGSSTAKTEDQFRRFRLTDGKLKQLQDAVDELKQTNRFHFEISWSPGATKEDYVNSYSVKRDRFKSRSSCPAGLRSFTILRDGQVTICEELYWNEQFIIGNILDQSIREIWSSEKALRFAEWRQDEFPSVSVCASCDQFGSCRASGIGVCWSNVIQAYGRENWKYPDPLCPKAPEPIHEIYSAS